MNEMDKNLDRFIWDCYPVGARYRLLGLPFRRYADYYPDERDILGDEASQPQLKKSIKYHHINKEVIIDTIFYYARFVF